MQMQNLFTNLTASEVAADWVDEKAVREVTEHELEVDRLRRVIRVVEAHRETLSGWRKERETEILTRLRAQLEAKPNRYELHLANPFPRPASVWSEH